MNDQSPLRASGSLLERAAELYGFGLSAEAAPRLDEPRTPVAESVVSQPPAPEREQSFLKRRSERTVAQDSPAGARPEAAGARVSPRPPVAPGAEHPIDRTALRTAGFIEPDAPGGALAEEFRIVKRQLLRGLEDGVDKARNILVCSAQPDEGKTFCVVNLALSLSAERDMEVLLVDADFPKPEILSILGIEGGAGLVDALADPSIDPESLILRTDVPGLSVLPAGQLVAEVTELLASEYTHALLARLSHPRRIILFDSPPALMASPASALASHAGQILMVVRADQTTEADLREAVALLSGCENIRLLLNGTGFAVTGRRFGSYYGYGQ